ncbi:peroxisomal 2,4-dienoyl-CoA reductase [(3E)-enoyl-CoA-producing]-like [Watersipora subatra]|uniref:peroxisomal 2,4-dienoyl-CoA reductase [(3E)-enoyl-CoA-producing]-like n=1 Tax=Watersipora subatra TaxID=2589382 RepID=UPI00355AD363
MATGNKMDSFEEEKCLQDYKHVFYPHILEGKVAFITGGGSGIGFTIAEIFMRHGCNVAIASRNLLKLQAAKKVLETAVPGRKCFVAAMDVRKPEQVKECVNQILSEYGRVDILVNNSAGNFLCLAESLSTNAYRNVIDIDTVGTFTVSKTVYDAYFKANGGIIVNISANLTGQPMQAHAASAKAAIDSLTKSLAVEWGPLKIRVVGVAPGPIADTVGYSKLGGSMISEDEIAKDIPLQRLGTRKDIAHTVLFLASDLASNITGTTLTVDGGSVLTSSRSMNALVEFVGRTPRM